MAEETTGAVATPPAPTETPPANAGNSTPTPEGEVFIPLQVDDEVFNLKPREYQQLAEFGYRALKEKSNPKPDTSVTNNEPKEPTVAELQAEFRELQNGLKHKEELGNIYNELNRVSQSNELTKTNEKLHQSISVETLAKVNFNPRLNVADTYNAVLKERLDLLNSLKNDGNDRDNARTKANALVNGSIRGGGNQSIIDASKKFSPEDIRSGASKRALEDFLRKVSVD